MTQGQPITNESVQSGSEVLREQPLSSGCLFRQFKCSKQSGHSIACLLQKMPIRLFHSWSEN